MRTMRRWHQLLIGEMNTVENKKVKTVETQEKITRLDEDGEVDTTAPGPNVPKVEIQVKIPIAER